MQTEERITKVMQRKFKDATKMMDRKYERKAPLGERDKKITNSL
jgi:hypothetical protein